MIDGTRDTHRSSMYVPDSDDPVELLSQYSFRRFATFSKVYLKRTSILQLLHFCYVSLTWEETTDNTTTTSKCGKRKRKRKRKHSINQASWHRSLIPRNVSHNNNCNNNISTVRVDDIVKGASIWAASVVMNTQRPTVHRPLHLLLLWTTPVPVVIPHQQRLPKKIPILWITPKLRRTAFGIIRKYSATWVCCCSWYRPPPRES